MINRFGQKILVAWAEHEIIWVKAVLTLDISERRQGFQEIADLTGRPYLCIRDKARKLRQADLNSRYAQLRQEATRRVMVPYKAVSGIQTPIVAGEFKWPSRAALRAGRSSIARPRSSLPSEVDAV